MTRSLVRFFGGLGLLLLIVSTGLAAQRQIELPDSDFRDEVVATLTKPVALAFSGDGRLLVTTQSGTLRVIKNGVLLATPALDLSAGVCTNSERGMLGVAVDPQFSANRFVYLYYTRAKGNLCVNRVARFTFGGGDTINPASEFVLLDDIPSTNGNHNAGDLHFGKDGKLYISVGDGGCDYAGDSDCAGNNDAARDRHILLGKILRINANGSIPADNPFLGPNSARCHVNARTTPGKICQETFAWGLRNPFRMAFDPNANGVRFFINDVGQGTTEEINQGKAGADYGWNVCEGSFANNSHDTPCPLAGAVAPVYEYQHRQNEPCGSITGGAFVPNGLWPEAYDNTFIFGDYVCGKLWMLTPDGSGGYLRSDFARDMGQNSVVSLVFEPAVANPALYYTTFEAGGQVRRVVYQGNVGNRRPTAVASANKTYGQLPLTVEFSADGSSDPDEGDTASLSYEWNFDDGTSASGKNVSHSYTQKGRYLVTLTVRDKRGAADSARLTINAGGPQPNIELPAAGTTFAVGQSIQLQASATDLDGTPLGVGAVTYTWEVLLHHRAGNPGAHTHPWFGPQTGNNLKFTTPAPEDLDAASNSYLEIRLTATENTTEKVAGFTSMKLYPRKVQVRFETRPAGLLLEVNGTPIRTPKTVTSWQGYKLRVVAPVQPDRNDEWLAPVNGQAQRIVVTGSQASEVIATFKPTKVHLLPVAGR